MSTSVGGAGGSSAPLDFDEIEQAVMESPRGRWFLAEHAKRQRDVEGRSLLSAIARLESAIAANQDELLQRLGRALESAAAAPMEVIDSPPPALTERQMKFFRQDEEMFEPAAAATAPGGKTRLIVRRLADTAEHSSPGEPARPSAAGSASMAEPPANPEPAAMNYAAAKRRIVIIRHKPGDDIDVPLQHELAEAG